MVFKERTSGSVMLGLPATRQRLPCYCGYQVLSRGEPRSSTLCPLQRPGGRVPRGGAAPGTARGDPIGGKDISSREHVQSLKSCNDESISLSPDPRSRQDGEGTAPEGSPQPRTQRSLMGPSTSWSGNLYPVPFRRGVNPYPFWQARFTPGRLTPGVRGMAWWVRSCS